MVAWYWLIVVWALSVLSTVFVLALCQSAGANEQRLERMAEDEAQAP